MEGLLRALSRVVLGGRSLEEVLTEVAVIAAEAIPGVESTSITLIRGDRPFTAAHFGEMVVAADEFQHVHGHGPCLDAGRGNMVLRIDDMRAEQRWPDYAARLVETGVRSSMSVPLPYQGTSIGVLNIYSTRLAAFAPPEFLDAGLQARTVRLAMESRAVIEQAKGVLMAQRHVDADQAFDILREASQRYNHKLRDIAGSIVASTQEQRPR